MSDETSAETESFERREGETPKAYKAFVAYRDAGAERSLRDTAKAVGKSFRHIATWSSKHEWVTRCDAYDRHVEGKRRRAQEKAIVEMAERHIREGMALQTLAIAGMKELNKRAAENRIDLSAFDITKLMDLGVKIERLSRGEATDRAELTGKDGESLTLQLVLKQ